MIKIHSIATTDDLQCSCPTSSGNVTIPGQAFVNDIDAVTLVRRYLRTFIAHSLLQITSDVFAKSILLALNCVRNSSSARAKRTILWGQSFWTLRNSITWTHIMRSWKFKSVWRKLNGYHMGGWLSGGWCSGVNVQGVNVLVGKSGIFMQYCSNINMLIADTKVIKLVSCGS